MKTGPVLAGIMLIDLVCHSEDIRRPTGMTRSMPETTLLALADTMERKPSGSGL